MKLLRNTLNGFRYLHWSFHCTLAYFLKGVARELKIASNFFSKYHTNVVFNDFQKKWLKKNENGEFYFDINGALLPYKSEDKVFFEQLAKTVFEDVFMISCFYNDNYDKKLVEFLDARMQEGPYGYRDGAFDITVKKDDVVIDAGAWIGDYSAYAITKGATVYAFEPVKKSFGLLCETADMNNAKAHPGKIYPIQKGLGDSECELNIMTSLENSLGDSFIRKENDALIEEKIRITSLDKFVEEHKLERVNFIKADIEGAERDLLKGATHTLKTFAPKLVLCTYHLPDDPEVLENLILQINPNYKVVQLRNKLVAAVVV